MGLLVKTMYMPMAIQTAKHRQPAASTWYGFRVPSTSSPVPPVKGVRSLSDDVGARPEVEIVVEGDGPGVEEQNGGQRQEKVRPAELPRIITVSHGRTGRQRHHRKEEEQDAELPHPGAGIGQHKALSYARNI